MKKPLNSRWPLVIALTLAVVMAFAWGNRQTVSAQSVAFGPLAATVSACPTGGAGYVTFCAVGTTAAGFSMYVSWGGAAYVAFPAPSSNSGVTSFNGRTGAVTLVKGDVTATGLQATTTVTITQPQAVTSLQ